VELHAAPAPVAPLRPPLEAELVQQGKLSMGQLAQAHRDRLEKGGAVLDIVVERGWVSADDVAALRAQRGVPAASAQPGGQPSPEAGGTGAPVVRAVPPPEAVSAPEVVSEPEAVPGPEAVLEPKPDVEPVREPDAAPDPPAPERQQPVATPHRIAIRLTNGELVAVGEADDEERAQAIGLAVISELAGSTSDQWPFFNGRYLRPETIVSVDIVAVETEATA
jgi:hypothetical protein